MKYYFFDDVKILKEYEVEENDKKILLNEGFEEPPEDAIAIPEVIQSTEAFGYRVYRTFSELEITHYGEYFIITEYPEQYNGIVGDEHILKWENGEAVQFVSNLVQLINKGYATIPMGGKIENGELVYKKAEEGNSTQEIEFLAEKEIGELKELLSSTDYIVIKIAEGSATSEEYAETLRQRKDARARINYLQSLLNSSDDSSTD